LHFFPSSTNCAFSVTIPSILDAVHNTGIIAEPPPYGNPAEITGRNLVKKNAHQEMIQKNNANCNKITQSTLIDLFIKKNSN